MVGEGNRHSQAGAEGPGGAKTTMKDIGYGLYRAVCALFGVAFFALGVIAAGVYSAFEMGWIYGRGLWAAE